MLPLDRVGVLLMRIYIYIKCDRRAVNTRGTQMYKFEWIVFCVVVGAITELHIPFGFYVAMKFLVASRMMRGDAGDARCMLHNILAYYIRG